MYDYIGTEWYLENTHRYISMYRLMYIDIDLRQVSQGPNDIQFVGQLVIIDGYDVMLDNIRLTAV